MAQPIRKQGRKALFDTGVDNAVGVENRGEFGERAEKQLRELLEAMEAVRKGDLTKKLRKEETDIFGELAESYNGMVDLLNRFGGEVTRVAREVGTEGKLGGQAKVEGVTGTWKELTDNVNFMASNLTNQVRNIATVASGIANGDLTQNSLPQEYADYVKIISDSDIPVISVLGNHDIRHGGINLFKEYFGKTYFSFNYADYKIIVMDASKRTISSSQLIWLENELKESDKSIVLAHIPAFKTPEISGEEYALKNGDELLKLFETYPPELVIFSHTHESDFAIKGETKYLFIDSAGGRMLESRDSYGYVSICIKGDVSYQRINLLPEH